MKLVLLLTFAAAVAGQTTQFPGQEQVIQALGQIFHLLDTNNDGELTLAEQEAYFDSIDTNDDGRLDFTEYQNSRAAAGDNMPRQPPEMERATFNFYDTLGGSQDADGFLNRDDNQYFFALQDLNSDGQVNLNEFDEATLQVGGLIAQSMGGQDPVGK